MPKQYEIDTKFLEFILKVCFILGIFSVGFLAALVPTGVQSKTVQSLYVLFMMLFTLFLGVAFALFIKWYAKYKTSLIKFR